MSKTKNPNHIRAALIRQGDSLTAWARRHDYKVATVHAAVAGTRKGKLSQEILSKLGAAA